MDLYFTALALGAVGLLAMALSGFVRGGHSAHGSSAHSGGAHGVSGAGAHAGHGHGLGHGVASGAHGAHGAHAPGLRDASGNPLLALMSPRVLFSFTLGLGATGLALRPMLGGGPLLFAAGIGGGVLLERAIVTPLWNFMLRFASEPALTLESAVQGDATAVTAFDANGQGLIAVEVDGRLVQLLGTLQTSDRELRVKVVAGSKLRVEEVDAERNRCTVSLQ